MKQLTIILVTMLCLTACHSQPTKESPKTSVDTTVMDIDSDIGEMLLVGFRGATVDSTNHIWRDITHFHVGSVILFDYDAQTRQRGRNIRSRQQVQKLCSQLRSLKPDLIISVDQEGGMVSRLHPRYGFPQIPSAQKSALDGLDSVRNGALLTATMLREIGINLNFAPVADVNVNKECPVIGKMERSFSSSAKDVTDCCRIWIDEQKKQGVISCMKHFPGHGSATGDTHKGLVDVSSTWKKLELEPYRQLISEVPMIMTAHVINRQLDPSGLPASLSPTITSYLRDSLAFKGVIVTDDMAMGAIVNEYSYEKAIRMALEAGADMLCLSNNGGTYDTELVPNTVRIIKKLVQEGIITPERIHTSAERIRVLKANK